MSSVAHSQSATRRHCRDVLGFYEPVIVLLDGEAPLTSRAVAEMELPREAGRYHEICFALVEAAGELVIR